MKNTDWPAAPCRWMLITLGIVCLTSALPLPAATFNVIGTYANWPTNWVVLDGLNDPYDGLANTQLDFVGDASNPGAYYAFNSDYVFFRQRVDLDTVSALSVFHDAHLVLIDLVGQDYNTTTKTLQPGTDGYPDYGFAWDSKSNAWKWLSVQRPPPTGTASTWTISITMPRRSCPTTSTAAAAPRTAICA